MEESPAFRPGSGRACGADADLAVAQGDSAAVLALDDELAAAVDEQGFGGVGLAVGADRDPVTGHEAEGAVFVEARKVRAEGQKLPRNGPGQCGAANGGGAARIQAACGAGQLLRPVGRGRGEVEADAHHQPFQLAALDVSARLGQNAADLPALIVEVVHPLDAQLQPAEGFHGPRHSDSGPDGHGLGIGGGKVRAEQQRKVNALAGRAFEDPAHPSAPGLLVAGEHQRPVRGTGQRQLLGRQVGAFKAVVEVDGRRVAAHGLGTERVAAGQPVAPAGGGVQRVPLGRKGGSGFVDGGAAHAERLGQPLAGDVAALGGGKRLQQRLLRI